MAFKICIKAVEMPAVGMGWQWRWRGRLEVPSPQQVTTPGRYWLVRHSNHWKKKKKEGEKSSQERKGRWSDSKDGGKAW